MRVGVVQGFLSRRYLDFWEAFLKELGVEVLKSEKKPLPLDFCRPVQELIHQVEALKAKGVGYLLLPDLQGGVVTEKGGGQCPWLLDLEAALLRHLPSLPPVLKVPVDSSKTLGRAAEIGQILSRNPMLVRRALDRTQRLLAPPSPLPNLQGVHLVGVVAQPYLVEDPSFREEVKEAFLPHDLTPYFADLPPERLREEGRKPALGVLLPTDLELLGQSHYLDRLGRIKALAYITSYACPPIPGLMKKAARRLSKPSVFLTLGEDWTESLRLLCRQVLG
ncbi:MAG: hypothetical protein ACUVUP_03365 [Thermaceae bacterium]